MKRITVVLFVLLAACGADDDEPSASTTTTEATAASTTSTTVVYSRTPVSTPEESEQGLLTAVTVGKHEGFTRVVFRFDNAVPGYSVKFAEPPFVQDGSGEEVRVSGNDWIAVRLIARAHADDGQPTVSTKRTAGPSGGVVTEVVPLGDFEGIVNYVIGTRDTAGMRVFTLQSPARLVVDVEA